MRYLHLVFIIIVLSTCSSTENVKPRHSFYYWKTSFRHADSYAKRIKELGVQHFYIHFFDVDWSWDFEMPAPVAELRGLNNAGPFIKSSYTPVVYITNDALQRMEENWCDSLAMKVRNKIIFITNRMERTSGEDGTVSNLTFIQREKQQSIKQVQFDSDWTESTRRKYFNFLRAFKNLDTSTNISATIRLYPYKYAEKLGVPPVNKGLLMCYNLTDIRNHNTINSIFNIDDLKQYLVGNTYPLPLDVALPVFGWYAWFRGGKFRGIVYPQQTDEKIESSNSFTKTIDGYRVLKAKMVGNYYLNEDDILRPEFPSEEQLEQAAELLHNKIPRAGEIAFYHWDDTLTKRYEKTIEKVYSLY